MENQKIKLMCSYGGKIQLRPHDHQLSYVGGDTKILTLDRGVKFSDMVAKLSSLCNCKMEICIKYQLPGEDLDSLVSLIDEGDVEQMMLEYDRMQKVAKPARLRLFIFNPIRLVTESNLNPDFLFGFDKDYIPNPNPIPTPTEDFLMQLKIPGIPDNSGAPKITGSEIQENNNSNNNSSLLVKNVHAAQGLRVNHVNGGSHYGNNMVQMVYGVPALMTGGYHTTGYGLVAGGGGGQYMDQPVYNFVPATTAVTSVMVPDQNMMMVSTVDSQLSREIKG